MMGTNVQACITYKALSSSQLLKDLGPTVSSMLRNKQTNKDSEGVNIPAKALYHPFSEPAGCGVQQGYEMEGTDVVGVLRIISVGEFQK